MGGFLLLFVSCLLWINVPRKDRISTLFIFMCRPKYPGRILYWRSVSPDCGTKRCHLSPRNRYTEPGSQQWYKVPCPDFVRRHDGDSFWAPTVLVVRQDVLNWEKGTSECYIWLQCDISHAAIGIIRACGRKWFHCGSTLFQRPFAKFM